MKPTKEQLMKENTHLETVLSLQKNEDQERRREFAKAFEWFEQKTGSIYTMSVNRKLDPRTPSWEEIFIEVGKLLSIKDFRDFEDKVSTLRNNIQDLALRINNNKGDQQEEGL